MSENKVDAVEIEDPGDLLRAIANTGICNDPGVRISMPPKSAASSDHKAATKPHKFALTGAQQFQAEEWLKIKFGEEFKRQTDACKTCKEKGVGECKQHKRGHPYFGAARQAEGYEFTPTTIGTIVKVKFRDE